MRAASLLTLILLAASSVASAAGLKERIVDRWKRQATELGDHLAAGEYKRALYLSSDLLADMKQRLGPAPEGATSLANVLGLRAMAAYGAGREDDALWHWHVAQALAPAVAKRDFGRYGRPADFLEANILEPAGNPRPTEQQETVVGLKPPRAVRAPQPTYPAGAREFQVSGTMVVLAIIDSKGRVREPRVLESLPAPTLTLAALEALREWRFEPAVLDGEPTAVWYHLSVNYRIQ